MEHGSLRTRFLSRFGLRTSLFVLLAVVAILAATQQSLAILSDRHRVIEEAQSDTLADAGRDADRQEHLFNEVRHLLGQMVRQPGLDWSSTAACRPQFQALIADVAALTSVAIVGLDGQPICSSSEPSGPGPGIADRPYFQAALATHSFVVSDFILTRRTGQPAVVAAMPLVEDGIVQAILTAPINVEWVSSPRDAVEVVDGAGDGHTLVLDHVGVVIGPPASVGVVVGQDVSQTTLWRMMTGDAGVLSSIAFEGREYVVGYFRLTAIGGVVVILRDRAEVLAAADGRAWRALGAVASMGAFLCLLIWLGGELMVLYPIRALTVAANRLGSGDLSARIDTAPFVPEFRRLGMHFNVMSTELEQRSLELNQANARLGELAMRDGLTGLGNPRFR